MAFSPIPELLEEIRNGRMVVIVDDEDRENEGDLIMAAELVKPSDINFMVTHARGLVCLSLTRERCAQLGLAPMVQTNTAQFHTNFTVSIEAAEGVTTGISAYDRAHTIRTAVRPDARPSDLSQPGHIFPLPAPPALLWRRDWPVLTPAPDRCGGRPSKSAGHEGRTGAGSPRLYLSRGGQDRPASRLSDWPSSAGSRTGGTSGAPGSAR